MEIITGYVGKPHVTAEQNRDVHIGIVGAGSYVLPTGSQMAAEVSSNNEIKIRDGVLMHQGCAASIKKNTYDSVNIVNGSQGMKRIDLIVARYERDEDTGIESLTLQVLQGTPSESNPDTPEHTEGDIQAGDNIADMPMYKVTLDGININKVEKLFEMVETNAMLTQKVNELNSTMKVNKISLGTKCGVTATCYYNDFMCEIDMEGKTTGTFTAWTGYQFDRLPLAKLYPGRDLVEYFPYHTEFYMEITPGGLVNMNAKQNVSTTGIAVQCSKVFMLVN